LSKSDFGKAAESKPYGIATVMICKKQAREMSKRPNNSC
jgi:hypothetical protein